MLISVSYSKDKWVVDEDTACIYPEFRKILRNNKDLGAPAIAYIALGCDASDDNPLGENFESVEERLAEAERCVFGSAPIIVKNIDVLAAIEKYIRLTDTPYVQARSDLNEALKNVGAYLKNEGAELSSDNIGPYVSAMEKLPKVLLAIKSLNQSHSEETEDKPKGRVKANKALGWAERQYLDKD